MKKKYLYISAILIQFIFIHWVFWWEDICEYTAEIDRCVESNISNTSREIIDFVCPNTKDLNIIVNQIILDKEFKKVDEKAELFLEWLKKDTGRFFWKEAKANTIDAVSFVVDNFSTQGIFGKQYTKICGTNLGTQGVILEKSMSCLDNQSITQVSQYLNGSYSSCISLAHSKLLVYEKVWINVLFLNKAQIRQDEKQVYMQSSRKNYNSMVDIMTTNISYLTEIWMKIPVKIQNIVK